MNNKENQLLKHNARQEYLDERKLLLEAQKHQTEQFDKFILTLASGALALSLTFINLIAPHPKKETVCFLVLAWVFFAVSILSTLISFLTSQHACQKQIDILEDKAKNNIWSYITLGLNWMSILLFILGIAMFIEFSRLNLPIGGN